VDAVNKEDVECEERNEIVDKLLLVLDWDRRRRADTNEIEENEEEDAREGTRAKKMGKMISERAQKAAHFAKREIEIQKLKKDREQRKARYLKEAGGLKYTALAMANRSTK